MRGCERLRTVAYMAAPMASRVINGEAVRACREALGLTQAGLAAAIKTDPSTISKIERGVHQPSAPTAWKLARRLGVPLSDISDPVPGGEPETVTP